MTSDFNCGINNDSNQNIFSFSICTNYLQDLIGWDSVRKVIVKTRKQQKKSNEMKSQLVKAIQSQARAN
jgi:hypothetical protein